MVKLLQTKTMDRFMEYGKLALQDGYKYDHENKDVIYTAMQAVEKNERGVTLMGNPGSGKTLFFEIMQRITHPQQEYFFVRANTLDVVLQFNQKEVGHTIFEKWKTKNVLFDDLGTEHPGKHFGEKVEVFEKFIQFRYELFREKGLKTHFTTNLNKEQILNRYGLRCFTRLEEMNDILVLGGAKTYKNRREYKNLISLPHVYHQPIKTEADLAWEKQYAEMKQRHAAMPQVKKHVPAPLPKTGEQKLVNQFLREFDKIYNENEPKEPPAIRLIPYNGKQIDLTEYLQTRLDEHFKPTENGK